MNRLTVEIEQEWFGPVFNLMVDGQHICDVLDCAESGIPCWNAAQGIPRYPLDEPVSDSAPDVRIVAVCSCSVAGCGHIRCNVWREGDTIVFEYFVDEHGRPQKEERFVFSRQDFDEAERLIVETMHSFDGK